MAEEAAPSAAPKKAKEKHDSANASIAIKPWDPQVPYLEPLRKARKGEAYQAYLAQKDHFASPAFYLDCAEFLLRAGEKQLGLRVLTNLAEMKLDDPPLLRVLAWRLSQAGELDLATSILEKVLRLRPEEPHSRRDLAMVLGDRAEAQNRAADDQRAVGLLYEVVQQNWDRFPEIELIALMELNRLIARAERRGWGDKIGAERVDKRLRKLLDLDLRVSLSWDADLTDVDLHLFEPTDEHAYFGHNRTTIGGLVSRDITQGYGPEEYILRRSVPGNYAVKVHYYGSRQQGLVGPATMIANVFTNYGRPDEKRQILTLRLDSPRDMEEVGVVTIAGRTGSSPQVAANSHVRTLAAFRTLRRGMSRDDLHAAVGQPDSKGAPLTYRLDDGSEVHVHVGRAGVDSVKHVGAGAELELLP
jgi:tetratricopeptide (TPR) repeat protein